MKIILVLLVLLVFLVLLVLLMLLVLLVFLVLLMLLVLLVLLVLFILSHILVIFNYILPHPKIDANLRGLLSCAGGAYMYRCHTHWEIVIK